MSARSEGTAGAPVLPPPAAAAPTRLSPGDGAPAAPPPMGLAEQRAFMAAFDPYRDLQPEETRRLYVDRENGPLRRIHRQIRLSPDLSRLRLALIGSRGAGKSSELRRLADLLAADAEAEVVPLFIDIASELPPQASTAAWLPLVAAAVRAARVDWGEPVPDAPPAGLDALGVPAALFGRLVPALGVVGAVLRLGSLGLGAAGQAAPAAGLSAAVEGLRGAGDALSAVQEATAAAQASPPRGRALQPVIDGIRAELEALEAACGRRPCLLLDGLDKRPTVEEVFAALDDAALLHALPCGIVLTGPVQLGRDPRVAAQDVPGRFHPLHLPTLRVVDREGNDQTEGQSALQQLFQRRWDEAGLGSARFQPGDLARLARGSSGIPRAFLGLVQGAFLAATDRGARAVEGVDVDAALKEARHRMERTLDQRTAEVLARVLEDGLPPSGEHAELAMNNLIIAHANGEVWHRPNELLVPFVQGWAAARGQRRGAGGPTG